ncbi:MAG: phosphoribosylformylglycinamidine synthase I [Verrucomicrobiales bacterium]|jgi:phosphoribosylformylglycinamidine synthase I
MARPKALLLKFPGTNCDVETARALDQVGFESSVQPISVVDPDELAKQQLLVFSGGFSYGDYVMAGRLAQLEIERRLGTAIQDFYANGGSLLGICNGFQILTKLGILPEGSLIENRSGRFVCRWTGLEKQSSNNAFLQNLPDQFELPVAHAEGRMVTPSAESAEEHFAKGHVALTYSENFNGSERAIAGLQDEAGRVLGLMPHPERFTDRRHHYDPDWNGAEHGWGRYLFESIYQNLS